MRSAIRPGLAPHANSLSAPKQSCNVPRPVADAAPSPGIQGMLLSSPPFGMSRSFASTQANKDAAAGKERSTFFVVINSVASAVLLRLRLPALLSPSLVIYGQWPLTDLHPHLAPHARHLNFLQRGFASSATTDASANEESELAFVNRHQEALTIAKANICYKFLGGDHPTLVTAGQMIDAGTFVTGKCTLLALVLLGRNQGIGETLQFRSSSWHERVMLDTLSESDIAEAFDKSHFQGGGWLRNAFKFAISRSLAHETAGQPRLVQYFLQNAARYVRDTKTVIDSEAAITKVLETADRMTDEALHLKERYTPRSAPDDTSGLFFALLFAGLVDLPLLPRKLIDIGGRQVRAFELIDKFNFYATADREDNGSLKAAQSLIVAPMLEAIPAFLRNEESNLLEGFLRLRLATVLTLFLPIFANVAQKIQTDASASVTPAPF